MDVIELNNTRVNRCRIYFDELILKELENYQLWIAGGAIRSWFTNERRSDVDLFFPNDKEREKVLNHMKGLDSEVVFENENVTKIKYKKQVFDICKPTFGSPQETIKDFDFTVSMFACNRQSFWCGEESFMDLASRRLCINKAPFPMSSLSRMQKYIRKGYWMCSEEMVNLTAILQGVDLTSFTVQDEFVPEFNQSDSGNSFPGMD